MAAEPSTTTADAASVVAARHEGWFTRISSAMRDPHYRNFYIGNVMQFGSMNMQLVVRGWLVFHITGSFAALGTMSLANAIPTLIFSPIGGVVSKRHAVPGEKVAAEQQILTIVDLARLELAGLVGLDSRPVAQYPDITPPTVEVSGVYPGANARIVADTEVGKTVDVVIIRKGKEETKQFKLGRLDDGAKPQPASVKSDVEADKPVTQKVLGLDVASWGARSNNTSKVISEILA